MMKAEEYLRDPCRASALPFYKTEQYALPAHMAVIRDDVFSPGQYPGTDEPYFKLVHRLAHIRRPALAAPFVLTQRRDEDLAAHINSCYDSEGVSPAELAAYRTKAVYDPALWIAVAERHSGRIVASGIGELDTRIAEGVLDWIQVSPAFRRRGLGRYIVCELLWRMRERADFVTVSGRVNNPGNPLALYRDCGFVDPVIWHVVRAI